jgi:hypothetical protein
VLILKGRIAASRAVVGAAVAEFESESRKEERVGRGVVKELNVLGVC